MAEPSDPVRALASWSAAARTSSRDLETEDQHGERPLEGLSSAPTTWTGQQDDASRAAHEGDEAESRRRSEAQVPPPAPDRTLPR